MKVLFLALCVDVMHVWRFKRPLEWIRCSFDIFTNLMYGECREKCACFQYSIRSSKRKTFEVHELLDVPVVELNNVWCYKSSCFPFTCGPVLLFGAIAKSLWKWFVVLNILITIIIKYIYSGRLALKFCKLLDSIQIAFPNMFFVFHHFYFSLFYSKL